MIATLYLLAALALAVGTAAVYGALIRPFPIRWLYWHARARKPLVWAVLIGAGAWVLGEARASGAVPTGALAPLALMAVAVALTYRMHQEVAFPAVDFPAMAADPAPLPLRDEAEVAVIEHGGEVRAYPLDYVIHHHVVNDRFGDRIVSLTYCAMCRSVIAFDVTELGPLFVGSFKNANMIVADRRTRTFFQQATAESVIGPLHPRALEMIPFQILPWREVRRLEPAPRVAQVSERDLREFQLPIPGIWRRIVASQATPGLPTGERDRAFPPRTRVVGVFDRTGAGELVYLKDEVLEQRVVRNDTRGFFLVAAGSTVNGFKDTACGSRVRAVLKDGSIRDEETGTTWDLRGKHAVGPLAADLEPIATSDEYWFSWRLFHPSSTVVRTSGRPA